MAKHLAIAKFAHESNSFTPGETGEADFRAYGWHRGEEARKHYAGTRTSIGAAVDFLDAHPDWKGTFLTCTAANPAGPVSDAVYEKVMGEIVDGLRGRTWDAVYLCLHGAMLRVSNPKADEEIVERVRAVIGNTPLGISYDLHGNMGEAQVRNATVSVGYKTHPHVDMYETTEKTLKLLMASIEGKLRPVGALARVASDFGGAMGVDVLVGWPEGTDWLEAPLYTALEEVHGVLEQSGGINRTISLTTIVGGVPNGAGRRLDAADFRDVVDGTPETALGLRLDECCLAVWRGERFKYVHFAGLEPLLFDLQADPHQLRNLAGDPAYQGAMLEAAQGLLSHRLVHAERTLSAIQLTGDGPIRRRGR